MALIDDALIYLQITWDDPALRQKLEGAMPRGQRLIDSYAGSPQDFDVPGDAQSLLFDYLRYVRCDAAEVFESNFLHDLIRLRSLSMSDMAIEEAQNAANQNRP